MNKITLKKYISCPDGWDVLISKFDSKTLFHETAWHKHLLDTHPDSKIYYFYFESNGEILGYFCGQVIRKFLFKIMGSPLGGTGTNYMGPIINKDVCMNEIISAINLMCKKENIHHIELSNYFLDEVTLLNHGYIKNHNYTHVVHIEGNEDAAFKSLKSPCRNRIKKGLEFDLQTVVYGNDTICIFFYDQFLEVYGKQGMITPFKVDRVFSLFNQLYPLGKLLPLVVKKGDDILATGLFPYDKNTIYFWGAASWIKYQKYCPNELLHWEVIKFAVKNNIKTYNMCGGTSQFKNKFGGDDVDHCVYFKSFIFILKYLRETYRRIHFKRLKIMNYFTKK